MEVYKKSGSVTCWSYGFSKLPLFSDLMTHHWRKIKHRSEWRLPDILPRVSLQARESGSRLFTSRCVTINGRTWAWFICSLSAGGCSVGWMATVTHRQLYSPNAPPVVCPARQSRMLAGCGHGYQFVAFCIHWCCVWGFLSMWSYVSLT